MLFIKSYCQFSRIAVVALELLCILVLVSSDNSSEDLHVHGLPKSTILNMKNLRSLAFAPSLVRTMPKTGIQNVPTIRHSSSAGSTCNFANSIIGMQKGVMMPIHRYEPFTNLHKHEMTRLFGTKRGVQGNPPGSIEIYNEQTTIPDLDIDKIKETITIIREIIEYPTYDISLIITEDEEMQQANLETRGVDRPTDILSFQFQDEIVEPGILEEPDFDIPDYYNLGDMMIDVPYVIRRCEEDREFNEGSDSDMGVEIEIGEDEDYVGDDDRGVSGVMSTIYNPQSRLQLLLVHGMLHLVGYDHIEDGDYDLMVEKEEEVIKELQKRLNEDWCDIE